MESPAVTVISKEFQYNNILDLLEALPKDNHVPLFSQWAAENRYIPEGASEFYGLYDPSFAPHLNEILDCFHPDNPVTHIAVMKSVQALVTTSVLENIAGAVIRYGLGDILSLTASKTLAKIRGSASIDAMIDTSGLADYIRPISTRMKRKSSDNQLYKEFQGKYKLLMSSYNSIADSKSNSFTYVLRDEWEEAREELKGQGDIDGITEGRTMGRRNFKIGSFSTPGPMQTSRIYRNFKEGDQRYYNVPCPECGENQVLELKGHGMDYGLTFTAEADHKTKRKKLVPGTVRYICRFCKKEILESKKHWMLNNGVWIPTATPIGSKRRSYQISSLMSPSAVLPWERICNQFIKTKFGENLLLFKDFTINYLGKPWARVEKAADWEKFRDRAEDYALGEVPDGVATNDSYRGPLLLFGGVDVQKDRLEYQVVGFGMGMEKWSIDYQIFYGKTEDLDNDCWERLANYAMTTAYSVAGVETFVLQVAVDSGYNPNRKRVKDWGAKAHIVYNFCAKYQPFFMAIKGEKESKTLGMIRAARISGSPLTKRFDCNVDGMKELLTSNLDSVMGPQAIHFPRWQVLNGQRRPLPDEHFKQFVSERYQETDPGKMGWVKVYQRNEVWDTFIYCCFAAESMNLSSLSADDWYDIYLNLK